MKPVTIDPTRCPICKKNNLCKTEAEKITPSENKAACWCCDPELEFPEALLEQIPDELKGKACICIDCVKAFQNND